MRNTYCYRCPTLSLCLYYRYCQTRIRCLLAESVIMFLSIQHHACTFFRCSINFDYFTHFTYTHSCLRHCKGLHMVHRTFFASTFLRDNAAGGRLADTRAFLPALNFSACHLIRVIRVILRVSMTALQFVPCQLSSEGGKGGKRRIESPRYFKFRLRTHLFSVFRVGSVYIYINTSGHRDRSLSPDPCHVFVIALITRPRPITQHVRDLSSQARCVQKLRCRRW
jgi:hypothetical protein